MSACLRIFAAWLSGAGIGWGGEAGVLPTAGTVWGAGSSGFGWGTEGPFTGAGTAGSSVFAAFFAAGLVDPGFGAGRGLAGFAGAAVFSAVIAVPVAVFAPGVFLTVAASFFGVATFGATIFGAAVAFLASVPRFAVGPWGSASPAGFVAGLAAVFLRAAGLAGGVSTAGLSNAGAVAPVSAGWELEVAGGLLSGVVIAKTPVALVVICNYVGNYALLQAGDELRQEYFANQQGFGMQVKHRPASPKYFRTG